MTKCENSVRIIEIDKTMKDSKMTKCKQYALIYQNVSIEYTGYFESVKKCIQYVKNRYGSSADEVLVRAVYPQVENEYYSVKTGKVVKNVNFGITL